MLWHDVSSDQSAAAPLAVWDAHGSDRMSVEPERTRTAKVEVYLLRVTEQLKKWPEMGERRRFWLSIGEAIELVEEPGIPALLRQLTEIEHTVLCPEHG